MTSDVNSFLMGSGGRSATFKAINDQVWGVVMNTEMRQQTDFKTKAKKFWDDGNSMMEAVITLLTEERINEDDDGLRKVYVKGQMQRAVAEAVRKAGATGIEDGGRLVVRYTGNGEATGGLNPPKLYFARYEPPTQAVPVGGDSGGDIDPDDLPF